MKKRRCFSYGHAFSAFSNVVRLTDGTNKRTAVSLALLLFNRRIAE